MGLLDKWLNSGGGEETRTAGEPAAVPKVPLTQDELLAETQRMIAEGQQNTLKQIQTMLSEVGSGDEAFQELLATSLSAEGGLEKLPEEYSKLKQTRTQGKARQQAMQRIENSMTPWMDETVDQLKSLDVDFGDTESDNHINRQPQHVQELFQRLSELATARKDGRLDTNSESTAYQLFKDSKEAAHRAAAVPSLNKPLGVPLATRGAPTPGESDALRHYALDEDGKMSEEQLNEVSGAFRKMLRI